MQSRRRNNNRNRNLHQQFETLPDNALHDRNVYKGLILTDASEQDIGLIFHNKQCTPTAITSVINYYCAAMITDTNTAMSSPLRSNLLKYWQQRSIYKHTSKHAYITIIKV